MISCSLILIGVLAHPRLGQAAEPENLERLRSIPRVERQALWEKLKEFDALSRSEQSAIRSLDERIAQLPPAIQANYRSVLRRYHQWVQGLTEAQRNELNAAPPSERMRLVTRLHTADRPVPAGNAIPIFLQVIDFSSAPSLFETAQRLKVWFNLTPERRAEIEKLPSVAEQQEQLAELGKQAKGEPVVRITKADEEAMMQKIEANPHLKGWLASPFRKADPARNEKLKRRMAANYYFLEHPPATVEPGRLMRFSSTLPNWYREQFDYLPPEEARRRLTILYRLIFPAPAEMPELKTIPARRSTAVPPPQRAPSRTGKPSPRPNTPSGASPF